MRFEKAKSLLQLTMKMQSTREGISLTDIEQEFGVGRRTAQRMRDAVEALFPQIEEVNTGERVKRWRLPSGVVNKLVSFEADDIASLDLAASILEQNNLADEAASISKTSVKIQSLLSSDVIRRIEPDVEALMEAEGVAFRAGPRTPIPPNTISEIRLAIKSRSKVQITYRKRYGKVSKASVVLPYGLVLGHRHYLIACVDHPKANKIVPFSLPNIETVDVLDEHFEMPNDFSIEEFVGRSFGVFQEEPFTTVWRFSPQAAPHAEEYVFHPSQRFEKLTDGSLEVHIKAGGMLEMAWHLLTWGREVTVIRPKELAEMVHPVQTEWRGMP
jgi:predicted DNA-binding transcriptional regulator YafY